MSKSRTKTDDQTGSIFEYLEKIRSQTQFSQPKDPTQGSLNIIDPLKDAMRQAIKASPLSRHQIAGEMSHLVGETVSKEQIDSWTRVSDEVNGRPARHVPAEYLPAFCKATQDNKPLIIMGEKVGLFVLPGPEALRSEIHRIEEEINEAKAEKKKRLMLLKEMEGTDG